MSWLDEDGRGGRETEQHKAKDAIRPTPSNFTLQLFEDDGQHDATHTRPAERHSRSEGLVSVEPSEAGCDGRHEQGRGAETKENTVSEKGLPNGVGEAQ